MYPVIGFNKPVRGLQLLSLNVAMTYIAQHLVTSTDYTQYVPYMLGLAPSFSKTLIMIGL